MLNVKTRFRSAVANKQFLITAEVSPPKGGNPKRMLEMAELLKDRVHAVNVTDGSRAVLRMSSLAALMVWGAVDSPIISILLAMTGDGCASIPTIRKAWMFPETETGSTYIASVFSVLLALPSIPKWNIENSAFQIYLLVVGLLIIGAIYRKRLGLARFRLR